MKLELENTDDPRNHKFEDLEQIIVLLNNPETGEQFCQLPRPQGRGLKPLPTLAKDHNRSKDRGDKT